MANEYLNNKKFEILISRFLICKKEKNKHFLLIEDIRETEKRTSNRKKYKKPENWSEIEKTFESLVEEYQELQIELTTAFYLLSENIVRYRKFNLIDPDDAIQEGVMICFEKVDRFDPEKGKAFNYMTTCIINHFRQLYRTARNYNELKKKYQDFLSAKADQSNLPVKTNKQCYKKQDVNTKY
jgi:DNA-directed RNA polymerase specialized sigma subunit